ncbi:MAG: hypothetical protein HKN20_12860 [Gemmatimonadetes bacterium]|nr:hypothetical protein [Gemmatimonadota bacterium]
MTRNVLICLVLCAMSCSQAPPEDGNGGGGGGGGTDRNAAYFTDLAWEAFDEGDYTTARNRFTSALGKDRHYAPARTGRAWSNIELGFTGLALSEFEQAVNGDSIITVNEETEVADTTVIFGDSTHVPAWYGIAFAAHAQGIGTPSTLEDQMVKTIAAGNQALVRGGDGYTYDRMSLITSRRLRAVLAAAYFSTRDYEAALNQVDVISPTNEINASDVNFVADLLREIEILMIGMEQ